MNWWIWLLIGIVSLFAIPLLLGVLKGLKGRSAFFALKLWKLFIYFKKSFLKCKILFLKVCVFVAKYKIRVFQVAIFFICFFTLHFSFQFLRQAYISSNEAETAVAELKAKELDRKAEELAGFNENLRKDLDIEKRIAYENDIFLSEPSFVQYAYSLHKPDITDIQKESKIHALENINVSWLGRVLTVGEDTYFSNKGRQEAICITICPVGDYLSYTNSKRVYFPIRYKEQLLKISKNSIVHVEGKIEVLSGYGISTSQMVAKKIKLLK